MSADILVRLRAWRELHLTRLGQLFDEAANHIESLRREVRTLRAELGQLTQERNMLLDWDKPPNHGFIEDADRDAQI
jgi:phage shock protein A